MKYQTGMFQGGDEYSNMCLVLGQDKYRALIGDDTFTYQVPVKPAEFDKTLTAAAGDSLTKTTNGRA